MTPEQIKAEKARLHDIVFDGAPDWANCAVRSHRDRWFYLSETPFINAHRWEPTVNSTADICYTQPETTLDWKDTMIKRGDV